MIQTGFESRVKVQQIIESQLPEFILDESPKVSEFLKQYYISQEYQGSVVDIVENLDQYLKVDNLTPEVIVGSTGLSTNITSTVGVVTVTSTKGFPQKYGLLKIDDEIITYTGITTNTFTGCIRGFSGITSYHQDLNSEELVFSTSSASSHVGLSTVQNLSSLFLQEFYKKLKYTLTPGLENLNFVSDLNVGNFLKEARTLYESKGTDESFRILFNILFGETPKVIDLEQFLTKPSSASYVRREIAVAEAISGDPVKLQGQTIVKNTDSKTTASVSEVEIINRKGKTYYKLLLFVGYDESFPTITGSFNITGSSKSVDYVSAGSSIITVDSTIGFAGVGTIYAGDNIITYTDKSINQFFGCSGIVSGIATATVIRSNDTYYGYEDGDLTKKVELRLTGVLSKYKTTKQNSPINVGEEILVKNLGESIKNPVNNRSYKQIFANSWIYNASSRYEVNSFNGSQLALKSNIDKSSLKSGDYIDIFSRGTETLIKSNLKINSIVDNTINLNINPNLSSGNYDIRRKLKKANSSSVSLEYNNLTSDIQNVYNEDDTYIYSASNSLPSYTIGKEIFSYNASGVSDQDPDTGLYTKIVFLDKVSFITGSEIYYEPSDFPISGLEKGTYYVEVLSGNKEIRIYFSKSLIGSSDYVGFGELTSGTHKFTLKSQKEKVISAQKILRKFPLSVNIGDGQSDLTEPGPVGMLINGTEILNYKSNDKIYYGPLNSIDVLSGGNGYDVINPPILTLSSGTALVQPIISGSIEKIYVDPQDFDIDVIVSIAITGGNGKGASFEPVIQRRRREIEFDARQLSNGGGVDVTTETITFLTNHGLINGEPIIYRPGNNSPLGIGTFNGSNADTGNTLLEESTYYTKYINDSTIQLYNSLSDLATGINTVGFTTIGTSGIHKFATNPKNTLSEIKVLNGGSGYTNRKLRVLPIGISTTNSTITFTNHGFESGELVTYNYETTAISGLSSSKQYYVIKSNNDTFKLADAGIGGTFRDNYERGKYVSFTSSGSGYQIFNYPEINLNIGYSAVGLGSTQVKGLITATPIVRGKIVGTYVYEKGSDYGSNILNFHKKPSVTIKNGKNAQFNPIILNGRIVDVAIQYSGSEYYSVPDIEVSGIGTGATLRPVVVNNKITDIIVVNSGAGYSTSNTTISVKSAGSGAIFDPQVRSLSVNNNALYNGIDDTTSQSNEIIISSNNNLQYFVSGYSEIIQNEFNDTGVNHSPIIGWAYDGNPIYGAYGYEDPSKKTSSAIKKLTSGYTVSTSNIENRPSGFSEGFFVEDYKFTNSGDLDRYNGRFCITDDFPQGIYAYFATSIIDPNNNKVGSFPYFIGNRYRSKFVKENKTLDQSFDFNNSNLIRNTFPYKVGDKYAGNDFIIESNEVINQVTVVESISKGSIENFEIVSAGSNYKVGDSIEFDESQTSGGGLIAQISEINGEDIVDLQTSSVSYDDAVFTWNNGNEVKVTVSPRHNLNNLDYVNISGFSSSLSSLNGFQQIGVTTYSSILINPIASSGIVTTDIYIANIPENISIGSSIGIGATEIASVLNVFPNNNIIRVLRGNPGYSHTATTPVYFIPNTFTINKSVNYFESSVNDLVYFNPKYSVGVGTTSGVGFSTSYNIGIQTNNTISIPTQSIYLPNHPFENNQQITFTKLSGSSAISVANTSTSTAFNLPISGNSQTVYVIKKSVDTIGIVTQIGLTTTTNGLFFINNGSDNYQYSLQSNFTQITGDIEKISSVVSVSTDHQLTNGDTINLTVQPNLSVGIGTSTAVTVKRNVILDSIVINSIEISSSSIDTNTNKITIPSHQFKTGDKIVGISGEQENNVYYIYKVDNNTIQLCETLVDALSNPPVVTDISIQSIYTFGNAGSGASKWFGGVLANNGKIYGIPYDASSVLEIDPIGLTTSTFGNAGSGTSKWIGGVLAPNGKIYAIPANASSVLVIDPVGLTTSTFGNAGSSGGKWAGGVLAPNGKIYGIPFSASSVLEIDPVGLTTSTFGNVGSGIFKWVGGVLAPNGKIYGIPYNASSVLEIDPIGLTTSTFGNAGSGTAKWIGGVLANNGKIYGIPSSASSVLEIDPVGLTTSTFGNVGGSVAKWAGGVLANNGKIYGIPGNATSVLEIDPVGLTTSTFGYDNSTSGKWFGGVLANNGKIYGIPYNASSILQIKTFNDIEEIQKINPQLNSIKNNNLVFDLTDSSLNGYNFKIFYDQDFSDEFVSTGSTTNFSVSGVGTVGVSTNASLTINYSPELPPQLFYALEKSGYISTADKEVVNYSQINFVDSFYNESYVISGVGTTTFTLSLKNSPEKNSYTQSECDTLKYTTSSTSASGGVSKIRTISSGFNYKKLPTFVSIESTEGDGAYILAKSDQIGKINEVEILNEGFEYASDKTLRPEAIISKLLSIKNSNTISNISVSDGGKNYTYAPDLIVIDTDTNEKINSGALVANLQGNTITSVSIVDSPKGLPSKAVTLKAINNTNGVGINSVSSSSSGIVTCKLVTPANGFNTEPFTIGDKIFVEGIQKYGIDGDGLNSENYGYQFFTVSNYSGSGSSPRTLEFSLSGLTTNPGIAKTAENLYGTIVNYNSYPKFEVTQIFSKFTIGETLQVYSIIGFETQDLKVVSSNESSLKVSGSYELQKNEIIRGSQSGSIATINEIESSTGQFSVSYSSEKRIGWIDNIGKLNEDTQVIPDNDYYQNLSYSVKSSKEWNDIVSPVNSLLHTSGLKNFADTEITNNVSAGIGSTNYTVQLYDIIDENRVDTINNFDLVKDRYTYENASKFLKFNKKRLSDYIECRTNRVLQIDDISEQFSSSDQKLDEFVKIEDILESKKYEKYLIQITNKNYSEIQLTELIVLSDYENIYSFEKSSINTGFSTQTGYEANQLGNVYGHIDETNQRYLRFDPKDPYNTTYNIKYLNTSFVNYTTGIGTTSIGFVKLTGITSTISTGSTAILTQEITSKINSIYSEVHLVDNITNQMSYVEIFVDHDGTNTNLSELYFDSDQNELSSNFIGSFGASISGGVLTFDYTNTSNNSVTIRSKNVGFGSTAVGIGTYRFKLTNQPNDTEKTVRFDSLYTKVSTASTIISFDKNKFSSLKSTVKIGIGSTSALHHVVLVSNSTNTYTSQQPFISIGSTLGIGTFGGEISGSLVSLKFYPDFTPSNNFEILSFNQLFYTETDFNSINQPPDLKYSNVNESLKVKRYFGINTDDINKLDFDLNYDGISIFSKVFEPSNSEILNPSTGSFKIPHFFNNGEELIYTPKSTFDTVAAVSVGIGSTLNHVGVVTNILPSKVYAIKVSSNEFKISTRKDYALAGIYVTFTSYGSGNAHELEMLKKNEKSIITIGNIIQSPISYSLINKTIDNGGVIGTASTIFGLSGISSIRIGDILKVDDEYMKVINVGLGTTYSGPISFAGTFPLVGVKRGFVGSSITSHVNSGIASIYRGSFNISGNKIYFSDPPEGSLQDQLGSDLDNLPEARSTFDGRVFFKSDYSDNVVYDDISESFIGIGQTYTLTVGGANTVGLGSTGGRGIVLINGIFQTPTTQNNKNNNFRIVENSGITSVVFSGIRTETGTFISQSDVNMNQLPKGGVIVSLGSTPGLGYAPLVGASVTAILNGSGTIVNIRPTTIGIGTTVGTWGSGYRNPVSVAVTDATSGGGAIIQANVGAGGTLSFTITNGGSGYTNPTISISPPSYENLSVVGVSRLGIGTTTATGTGLLINVEVGASSTTGIGSTLFNVTNFKVVRNGYNFKRGDVVKAVGLVTAYGLSQPVSDFQLTILETFNDSFSAWQFGELDYIDSIENLKDGSRTTFPLNYNSQLLSFEIEESSSIDPNTLLIIFINGILQKPGVAYQFNGGTTFTFTEAPKVEDNVAIFFYRGSSADSSIFTIPETLKPGDDVQVFSSNDYLGITTTQDQRTISGITTSDLIETKLYTLQGIDEKNYKPLSWTKQKVDKIINGELVSKARDSIESQIYPTAKIIKNINSTDTEIYVDNAQFFNYENVSAGSIDFDGLIVSGSADPVSAAITAVVSAAGTIQSLSIVNGGSGYTGASINVKISAPSKIGIGIGTTASATVSIANGFLTTPITITNSGLGYTTSAPPQVIAPLPDLTYENISGITAVSGVSGNVTGIGSTVGIGTDLAIAFTLSNTNNLVVGQPIYIFDTRVGNSVTSIYSNNTSIVGVGTTFLDNIYVVAAFSSATGIVTCNIHSGSSTVGIATTGSSVGKFSWGKLSGFTRSSSPVSIAVSGFAVNSGLTTFPTIQRRGYGLRSIGPIKKTL